MKKQFKSIFFLLIVMSVLLTACGGAQSETIRIASDTTWPPFEYIEEGSMEPVGFDIDLINMIAEKEGLDIEIIPTEWDALLAGMSQCQYDAAISAITITEERKETMLFSDPYIAAGQVVTIVAGDDRIGGPADLADMVVGAQIGTTGAIEVEGIEGATLKTYDSVDLAYLDLSNGQIDAVVADYPTAYAFVGQSGGELALVGEVFTDENYGIAVCNENTELLEKLNAGLAAVMAEDGTMEALEAKWLAGE